VSFWTPDIEKMLRVLWHQDIPAVQIAAAIEAKFGLKFTRNAVIGKAGRMGLGAHANATNQRKTTVTDKDMARRAQLLALSGVVASPPRVCQWPHGDPGAIDYHVCGSTDVIEGKPYCAEHCAVAYRKPEPYERKEFSKIRKGFGR
jgi:hypothetical protein